jgi:hypothetical protein
MRVAARTAIAWMLPLVWMCSCQDDEVGNPVGVPPTLEEMLGAWSVDSVVVRTSVRGQGNHIDELTTNVAGDTSEIWVFTDTCMYQHDISERYTCCPCYHQGHLAYELAGDRITVGAWDTTIITAGGYKRWWTAVAKWGPQLVVSMFSEEDDEGIIFGDRDDLWFSPYEGEVPPANYPPPCPVP